MLLTPQETRVMRGRQYDKILTGLQKAYTMGDLTPVENTNNKVYVLRQGDTIPAFSLPIVVLVDGGKKAIAVIDLRIAKQDYALTKGLIVTLSPFPFSETQFLVGLAIAQLGWMYKEGCLAGIFNESAKLFGIWIGSKIAKRLSLNPEHRNQLIAAMMFWFFKQSLRTKTMNNNEYGFIVGKIALALRMNGNEAEALLNGLNIPTLMGQGSDESLEGFCQLLSANIDSPKMNGFNSVLLQTILMGSWFGVNNREMIAVAVEYPPYFIMMVYRSLGERSFKDTDIAQVATKTLQSSNQKQFSLYIQDALTRIVN